MVSYVNLIETSLIVAIFPAPETECLSQTILNEKYFVPAMSKSCKPPELYVFDPPEASVAVVTGVHIALPPPPSSCFCIVNVWLPLVSFST